MVVSGKVLKTQIFSAANREMVIPVKLTAEIQDILAKAGATLQNPQFRISIKGKVAVENKPIFKFKKKFVNSFSCPTKLINKDAQYWMMNTCGISQEVINSNNKIQFGFISVIQN